MRTAGADLTLCEVWWAPITGYRPELTKLLDARQARRVSRLRRPEDRSRLVVAAALARTLIGRRLSCPPAAVRFDRTCRCGAPHGKPTVIDGDGLELSVSHSGDWIVVALAGTPVGIDVEQREPVRDVAALVERVLSPEEREVLQAVPETVRAQAFLRYWTRKEAVLKATGDGLAGPMNEITVTAPAEPAALREWEQRPDMPDRMTLADLDAPGGYLASVAILDAPDAQVRELDGSHLLAERAARNGAQRDRTSRRERRRAP